MSGKKTAAIVLAAGQGKRMQSKTAKQFLLLAQKPVIYYALEAFEKSEIDDVVLVTGADQIEFCREEVVKRYGFSKVRLIVSGGAQRYHSVANGLEALASSSELYDKVLIHDGARPFVTPEMISDLVEGVEKYEACVTATQVKDTIKIVDEETYAKQTPNRDRLWAVQTPQAFSFSLIVEAYRQLIAGEKELLARGIQITDDAMVVEEMAQKKVKMIPGDYRNIKLTTPEDLYIAEAILRNR